MSRPRHRKVRYDGELQRLLGELAQLSPTTADYEKVLKRIDELDKIHNRTSELVKTLVPVLATAISATSIYFLQQAVGVLPRAIDATMRSSSRQSFDS